MYAIIDEGGQQIQVEEGEELQVDYRDLPAGSQLTFDRVLAIRDEGGLKIGQPLLASASVTAEVPRAQAGAEARGAEVPPPQECPPTDRPPPNLHPGEDQQDHSRIGVRDWRVGV